VFSLKFKTFFLFFNIIIVVFVVIFFAGSFFSSFWPLMAAVLPCALVINVFCVINFRLYRLLEREDWHALAQYLEHRVLEQGRFSAGMVGLLANTAFVLSDFEVLRTLENRIAQAKPALLEAYALVFGAARILGGDYAGAERFLAARAAADGEAGFTGAGSPASAAKRGKAAARERESWLRWYRGFALFLGYQYGKAADIFCSLARFSGEPLTTGLAAWFLARSLAPALPERAAELSAAAETGRARTRSMLVNAEAWERAAARRRDDIYVVILLKYTGEAAGWLFSPGELTIQDGGNSVSNAVILRGEK
jgi:hypothetical protein